MFINLLLCLKRCKSLCDYYQATSYKSRIVFTNQAAEEEERSPKILIDDSVITNEIPDVELVKVDKKNC